MAGYDPNKAAQFNKLRQQGVSEDAALAQSGISDADVGNYAIGMNGQMGALIIGTEPRPGIEVVNRVDYDEKADAPVSSKTPTTYTTTSTETVSGGGSRTITIPPRQPTDASQALDPQIAEAQARISEFNAANPSDFTRKLRGLPPLTPEERQARQDQLDALTLQKADLQRQQAALEAPSTPVVTTVPNTTTTTTTVSTVTAPVNSAVQTPDGPDPTVNQQNDIANGTLNTATPTSTTVGAADPANVPAAATPEQTDVTTPAAVNSSIQLQTPDGTLIFQNEAALRAWENNPQSVTFSQGPEGKYVEPIVNDAPVPQEPVDANQDPGAPQTQEAVEVDLIGAPSPQPDPYSTTPLEQQAQQLQDAGTEAAKSVNAGVTSARNQSTLQARYKQPAAADWRVRLQLAPNSNYLYKAGDPGILAPLNATDGVIFPYTPNISLNYTAKYDPYDLIHSNYRGYFYKGSSVDNISVRGTFTAQSTREAAYLLAVIHFFRSVTKMFYGQDQEAGTPPPLVYLSGLGQYQFNNHPCVVSNFNYNLPNDVDYIRANGFNNIGVNMENRRNQSSGPGPGGALGVISSIATRLLNSGLKNGSESNRPSPSQVNQTVTNQNSINSTYVPTKMEVEITLLPMQTRNQVSKQFSLKGFANGNLLKGGFW